MSRGERGCFSLFFFIGNNGLKDSLFRLGIVETIRRAYKFDFNRMHE